MKSTIFQRYGGFASVSKVVMSFYDKVLESPIASPYFAAQVMGGPASYTDEQFKRVHSHLGITEIAFKETMELLMESLEYHDFADEDIKHVEGQMMDRKNFIITKR